MVRDYQAVKEIHLGFIKKEIKKFLSNEESKDLEELYGTIWVDHKYEEPISEHITDYVNEFNLVNEFGWFFDDWRDSQASEIYNDKKTFKEVEDEDDRWFKCLEVVDESGEVWGKFEFIIEHQTNDYFNNNLF